MSQFSPSSRWLYDMPNGNNKEQLSRLLNRALLYSKNENSEITSLRDDLMEALSLLEKEQFAHTATKKNLAATKKNEEKALLEKAALTQNIIILGEAHRSISKMVDSVTRKI